MTMKRVIFLALALSLAACKTTDDPDNTRAVGAVAGAVLGAFVGYQFGGGSGQMIMTVLGAVGGGAGGYYAADYIIKRDKKKMKKAAYKKSDTEKVTIDFAAALWESGKSEAAVNVIETWLKKHPDRINAQFELANYYLLQNRSEDAKPLLVLLAKRQPNNWIVLNNLADALKHEDRIEALRLTTCLIARLAKPRARAASADVGACTAVTATSFSIPKTTNNASRTATESGRNTNNSQPSARIRFAPTKHVKWTPRNGSTDCIRDPPFDERLPIDR